LLRQSVSIESLFESGVGSFNQSHTAEDMTDFRYEGIYAAEGEQVDRAFLERPAAKSTGENSYGVDIYEVVGSCGKITLSASFPQIC
jgi:hypothetical protein